MSPRRRPVVTASNTLSLRVGYRAAARSSSLTCGGHKLLCPFHLPDFQARGDKPVLDRPIHERMEVTNILVERGSRNLTPPIQNELVQGVLRDGL
jgi:hypothetical protein